MNIIYTILIPTFLIFTLISTLISKIKSKYKHIFGYGVPFILIIIFSFLLLHPPKCQGWDCFNNLIPSILEWIFLISNTSFIITWTLNYFFKKKKFKIFKSYILASIIGAIITILIIYLASLIITKYDIHPN